MASLFSQSRRPRLSRSIGAVAVIAVLLHFLVGSLHNVLHDHDAMHGSPIAAATHQDHHRHHHHHDHDHGGHDHQGHDDDCHSGSEPGDEKDHDHDHDPLCPLCELISHASPLTIDLDRTAIGIAIAEAIVLHEVRTLAIRVEAASVISLRGPPSIA